MRAMSLGLVKGSIDEVGQTVEITYVKVSGCCCATFWCRPLVMSPRSHGLLFVTLLCASRQARVLDKGQVRQLATKLTSWCDKVAHARTLLENNTADLLA